MSSDSNHIQFTDRQALDVQQPRIMGILNITPDSFSDGGKFMSVDGAVTYALRMIDEGADIIDIGGESTRPGAQPVRAEEEIRRVAPVIEAIRRQSDIPISIDTYRSATAEAALSAGADMINDISALRFDSDMARLAAERRVPVVLMHMQGDPKTMQSHPTYDDCVREIAAFFAERIQCATAAGIKRSKLILDPGIGFGKRPEDNLAILARLDEFICFHLPLLVGASRKSFIGIVDATAAADQRLGGSVAAAVIAVMNGANIVRVHDVRETVQAIRIVNAVSKA